MATYDPPLIHNQFITNNIERASKKEEGQDILYKGRPSCINSTVQTDNNL